MSPMFRCCEDCGGERLFEQPHAMPGSCPDVPRRAVPGVVVHASAARPAWPRSRRSPRSWLSMSCRGRPGGMRSANHGVRSDYEAGRQGNGAERGSIRHVQCRGRGAALVPGPGAADPARAILRGDARATDAGAVRDRDRRGVRLDGAEVATGRFVLLYDPAGQRGWAGPLRVIVYIRAELEPEIAEDPMVGQVAWSWLTEALDARTAGYAEPSGTVTRVVTEGFGAKREEPPRDRLRAAGLLVPGHRPGRAGARRGRHGHRDGRAHGRVVRDDVRRGGAAAAGRGGQCAPPGRAAAQLMTKDEAADPARRRQRLRQEPAVLARGDGPPEPTMRRLICPPPTAASPRARCTSPGGRPRTPRCAG